MYNVTYRIATYSNNSMNIAVEFKHANTEDAGACLGILEGYMQRLIILARLVNVINSGLGIDFPCLL